MYSETLTQQKLNVMNSSTISRIEEILSDEAIAFIYHLETKFGNKRVELLKDREKVIGAVLLGVVFLIIYGNIPPHTQLISHTLEFIAANLVMNSKCVCIWIV